MKFMRVMNSLGGSTFDDVKQDLEEFHRKGRTALVGRAMTRQRRRDLHDFPFDGKEVGSYSPNFSFLERR